MKQSTNIEDVYTLSPLQEGILFHSIYQKDSSAYFIQVAYRFSGSFDPSIVKSVLQKLINRHDILRSSFVYKEMDKPLQVVLKNKELPFQFEDISHLTEEERTKKITAFKAADEAKYFDLAQDCLMRAAIFKLTDQQFEFIWSFHHIIIDGWCLKILERDFFTFYEDEINQTNTILPPAPQYKNYIQWLEEKTTEDSQAYWANYLNEYSVPTTIPKLLAHQEEVPLYNNDTYVLEIADAYKQQLEKLAQKNRVTLNNVVRTLWGILLAKYNDQKEAAFGAVVSGRPPQLDHVNEIVGLFINTVPIRVQFDQDIGFDELLRRVNQDAILSAPFHHYPLAEIQNLSALKERLFDHIIVFENYPVNNKVKGSPFQDAEDSYLTLIEESVSSQNHYPFYIIITNREKLRFKFFYNKKLYPKSFVEQLGRHLTFLMEQCIADNGVVVDQLTLVKRESTEYQQLVYGCNETQIDFPLDTSIKEVFEQTVADFPSKVAIRASGITYTYEELNRLGNQLARLMQKAFSKEEDRHFVGVLVNRPEYAVVAMIATMKAGGVFIPIHPDLPRNMINNRLGEVPFSFFCLESNLMDRVQSFTGTLFAMDIQLEMLSEDSTNLTVNPEPKAPIYAIYSSGTTGNPKGALISNQSLLNYFFWFKNTFDFASENRGALLSSYAFDLGYTTIWGCLLSGASLYLPQKEIALDPNSLLQYLLEHNISFLKLTPSNFKILLAASQLEKLSSSRLALILLGGEKIQVKDLEQYHSIYPKTQFVNHYGPTETTIGAIFHPIDSNDLTAYRNIPVIGKPISNAKAYLLDDRMQVLPVGAKGNLYLAGPGLAIEYLSNKKLTEQKFMTSQWNERLYQTGDKARRHQDGSIAFLGREDKEVKVRGHRVDLEEIETILMAHDAVKHAAVLVKPDATDDLTLLAFVQSTIQDEKKWLAYLKEQLPHSIMPNQIIVLDRFPLTNNGKLDIKKLKSLHFEKKRMDILAPTTETEKVLLGFWKEVLDKEIISTDDDFFKLGGHSLKAVQIVSRVIKAFQINIGVKEIFDNTNIQSLAKRIDQQVGLETNGQTFEEIII